MTGPRPHWAALYLLALSVTAATVAVLAVAGPARVLLGLAVWTAAAVAGFRWIAANRVALDHLDWCACASAPVGIRIIAPHASPMPADQPEDGTLVEVEDHRLATLPR
jgi:hypothetical protein